MEDRSGYYNSKIEMALSLNRAINSRKNLHRDSLNPAANFTKRKISTHSSGVNETPRIEILMKSIEQNKSPRNLTKCDPYRKYEKAIEKLN